MKGDFSRNSFDPNKQYRGVRMQQGRVQIDADWNEQIDITDYRDCLFTEDFLGNGVGPNTGSGFAIDITADQQDLTIGLGRYYVNGLLAENSSSLYFTQQTDYPYAALPNQDGVYLTYLEVWQRSLSNADDVDIAESALGGADTATRLYTVTQVKLMPTDSTGIANLTYNNLFNATAAIDSPAYNNAQLWNAITNRLPANVNATQLLPDVTKITSSASTTYRIQIHQGGNATQASYKVSTDNPLLQMLISAISVDDPNNQTITLVTQQLLENDEWLELSTTTRDTNQMPGDMVKITSVSGSIVTVSGNIGADIVEAANNLSGDASAKRWLQNVTPVIDSNKNPLEIGLTIHFLGNAFETGSYWQITTNNNTINWPNKNGQFVALPPNSTTISQLTPTVDKSNRLQNQLYRIEIHQSSGGKDDQGNPIPANFKWSRDNASVSSRITSISSNVITLQTLPQDGISSFMPNQWLELTTPARELMGQPGNMVQVTTVNDAALTVKGTIDTDITVANRAIARRWDTAVTSNTSEAINPITVNKVLPLENGLSITFSGSDFQTGDYWLIPARSATNNQGSHIDWPLDANGYFLTQLPNGIQRSYAPLAIVQCSKGIWNFESDARILTIPLSELNIKVIGADPCAPANTIHVDCNGQVGISTDTPKAKLDVQTSAGIAGQDAIHAVANNNGIAIKATTDDNFAAILTNNSTSHPALWVENTNSNAWMAGVFFNHSPQLPALWTQNDNGGPAGKFINTSATSPTLTAENTGDCFAAIFQNNSIQPTLQITNSGSGQALQTNGNATISGSLTINNTNSGSFSVTPTPNKVPVADQFGHIDTGWLLDQYVSINALQQGTYITAIDMGSINAIVLNPSNTYLSYVFGTQIEFLAQHTNTGPTTVTINSNAIVNLVVQSPLGTLSLSGGEVVTGNIYRIFFDGSKWQLMNPSIQKKLVAAVGFQPSFYQSIPAGSGQVAKFNNIFYDENKWWNNSAYGYTTGFKGTFRISCVLKGFSIKSAQGLNVSAGTFSAALDQNYYTTSVDMILNGDIIVRTQSASDVISIIWVNADSLNHNIGSANVSDSIFQIEYLGN